MLRLVKELENFKINATDAAPIGRVVQSSIVKFDEKPLHCAEAVLLH